MPVDTENVALPDALLALVEELAENTHEVWARGRRSEGWCWGPRLDPAARQHPNLVPYGQLPESEKRYDRETALEALRFVIKRGFRIFPPDSAETC